MAENPNSREEETRPPSWLFRHFSRRGLMIAAIIIASIPTAVVVIAFPIGNRVAESNWKKLRSDWESQGEVFELEAYLGSPIPDSDNFAKASIIDDLYRREAAQIGEDHHAPGHNHDHPAAEATPDGPLTSRMASFAIYGKENVLSPPPNRPIAFLSGRPVDLLPYVPAENRTASAASYLREAFAPHEPIIEELMAAAQRSGSWFPVNLKHPSETRISHMPALISAFHSLRLYNLVLIESGPEARDLAAERLIGTLRLIRHGTESQGLASYSIRIMAMESAGLEVVWQALHRHRFSEEQWAAVDRELRAFEFGPRLMHSLRFERAAMVRELEDGFARKSSRPFSVPPAWVQMNGLIEYAELTQRYWFTDAAGGRLLTEGPRLEQLAAVETLVNEMEQTPNDLIVAMGILPVHNFAVRAAWIEAQHTNALIAIAIERFRLANHRLPEKLSEMVPQWLDELPVSGRTRQPRYQRSPASPDTGVKNNSYRLQTMGDDDDPDNKPPRWLMPEEVPIQTMPPS